MVLAALALGILGAATVGSAASAGPANGSISGKVTTTDQYNGVDQGQLHLLRPDGSIVQTITPPSSGYYSFTSLPAGSYRVEYTSIGTVDRYWPSAFHLATAGHIDITDHEARAGIDFTAVEGSIVSVRGVVHQYDTVCWGWEGITYGETYSSCFALMAPPPGSPPLGGWNPYGFYAVDSHVAPDETYLVWAYEYDQSNGRYTDTMYWNNTGGDRRPRSNATPYPPISPYARSGYINTDFRLDWLPWLGYNPTTLAVTSSVSPLYVGATTSLTATLTGYMGPAPSGLVEFYDDQGFIGEGRLSASGVATISYKVTHAVEWLVAVEYRGDSVYAWDMWDVDFIFKPTIGSLSPSRAPIAGGSPVTITGYALTGATSVTFDGIPGTDLVVVSDTEIMVTTPPGTVGPAVVIVTNGIGASVPGTFLYEVPAVSVTPDAPPAIVVCPDGTRVNLDGPPCHVRVGPPS